MSPIAKPELMEGTDWGYQLKWDGVRTIATLEDGQAALYSKRMLLKNSVYPEITEMLAKLPGRFMLDGEIIMFDTEEQRPNFQKVLQRERSGGIGRRSGQGRYHLCYVLFDLLYVDDKDIRGVPFETRHAMLLDQFPTRTPQLFVTDLVANGQALWNWALTHNWEGVISKRLSSPYREGKQHSDWFKKKIAINRLVQIVGLIIRNGKVASLVMALDGDYFGRVSLGLSEAQRQKLMQYASSHQTDQLPWASPPEMTAQEQFIAFYPYIACHVTGLEITLSGVLRHPKIVQIVW